MNLQGKNNYKVLVIDDDEVAVEELKKALAKHASFSIAATAGTAGQGRGLIMAERPDLLFLDVELPDMLGVKFLNSLKDEIDWDIRVVFYSAHSKYILNAMRESAFDYLVKPFEQAELDGIIARFEKEHGNGEKKPIAGNADGYLLQNSFLAATLTGYKMIRIDEIGYFVHRGLRKQWHAVLADGESLCLRRGTSAETILGYSPSFVQISQSCIININYLAMICGSECKLYPPFDNASNLAISRNYLRKLQEIIKMI